MVASKIYYRRQDRIILARDRAGEKPFLGGKFLSLESFCMGTDTEVSETMKQFAFVDGEYSVPLDGLHLSMLVQGRNKMLGGSEYLLVMFSGAISNREGTEPPYFSGVRIAEELGLPLLSFSDPTLNLDDNIPLGFFAGNQYIPRLPKRIAEIIDDFAGRYNLKPILAGGSGGGFASLNVAQECNCDPLVFVWNPQTQILEYDQGLVRDYLRCGYPDYYNPDANLKDHGLDIFKELGVKHSVIDCKKPINTVYIQNRSDWHFGKHLVPFVNKRAWKRVGRSGMYSEDTRVSVFSGNWGRGHAVPPRNLILSIICNLANGKCSRDVLENLTANGEPYQDDLFLFENENAGEEAFHVDVKRRMGVVCSSVSVNCARGTVPREFAFYLMSGKEVIEREWYSASRISIFKDPGGDDLYVTGFVRDDLGVVMSKTVKVA